VSSKVWEVQDGTNDGERSCRIKLIMVPVSFFNSDIEVHRILRINRFK